LKQLKAQTVKSKTGSTFKKLCKKENRKKLFTRWLVNIVCLYHRYQRLLKGMKIEGTSMMTILQFYSTQKLCWMSKEKGKSKNNQTIFKDNFFLANYIQYLTWSQS
jgi:hypothetical protein